MGAEAEGEGCQEELRSFRGSMRTAGAMVSLTCGLWASEERHILKQPTRDVGQEGTRI